MEVVDLTDDKAEENGKADNDGFQDVLMSPVPVEDDVMEEDLFDEAAELE